MAPARDEHGAQEPQFFPIVNSLEVGHHPLAPRNVFEAMDRVLARVTSPEVSEFYQRVHKEEGVDIRLNASLSKFEKTASGLQATTNDGDVIPFNSAIIGIGVIPNTELALDRLSYQLQLRHTLLNDPESLPSLAYKIADRDKIKQYQFEIIGEEKRDTPLGLLNTVKIKVIRSNKKRTTYIWFAPQWQYLLVHLEQYENNKKEFSIQVASAEINGEKVQHNSINNHTNH